MTANLMDFVSSSASPEWYTPDYIIAGVVAVLGAIDCDPCSNPAPFNVPATVHYTQVEDGLLQSWPGRVYMNPPYGDVIEFWVNKLAAERAFGHCTAAITLTPARTDTVWFQGLWRADALCFIYRRIKFKGGVDKGGAPFPTVLGYFGPDPARFAEVFESLGKIVYPNAPYRRQAHQLTLLDGAA